jgi:hypothetical protein
MTVRELKKMLDKYPEEMELIHTFCSDYDIIEECDFSVIKCVAKPHYVMRSHATMSKECKRIEKEYLHLR